MSQSTVTSSNKLVQWGALSAPLRGWSTPVTPPPRGWSTPVTPPPVTAMSRSIVTMQGLARMIWRLSAQGWASLTTRLEVPQLYIPSYIKVLLFMISCLICIFYLNRHIIIAIKMLSLTWVLRKWHTTFHCIYYSKYVLLQFEHVIASWTGNSETTGNVFEMWDPGYH